MSDAGNRYEDRLGTDRMLPLVFRMALPSVVAQIVNLLYNIVDRIFIGRIPGIGTDALAGVGVTGSVIILISAFSMIVGGGAAPLASIALGQGNRERAERILGNGFLLLILFAVSTAGLTYAFMEPLLMLTGASVNTIGYATDYLNIYLTGTVFVQIATGLNSFISAQGRPGIAMLSTVIGALTNLILDPVFIFGMDMGVKGAALATVISQAFSALWVLRFLFSPSGQPAYRQEPPENGEEDHPGDIFPGSGTFRDVMHGKHSGIRAERESETLRGHLRKYSDGAAERDDVRKRAHHRIRTGFRPRGELQFRPRERIQGERVFQDSGNHDVFFQFHPDAADGALPGYSGIVFH